MTRRLFRVTAQEPEWVKDWVDSELVERVEVIEAQVELLDGERDRLETELAERVAMIDAQVELLDAERTRLETDASVGQSRPPRPPRTVLPPQAKKAAPIVSGKAAPIDWARLALLAGFVLAAWALIGALIYIARLLLA